MKQYFEIEKIKQIILFATSYSFLLAILYLYAFWSSFNINFLEHISISDILKASIYPLLGIIIGLTLGTIIGEYLLQGENKKPPEKRKRFQRQVNFLLFAWYISMAYNAFDSGLYMLWFYIPMGIFPPAVAATRKFLLEKELLKPYYSIGIWYYIALLICIPIMSFGIGKSNSHKILNNSSVRYAKTSQFNDKQDFGEQKQIKYIGLGGNYYFFLSIDNSKLYILNSDEVKILELSKLSSDKRKSPSDRLTDWFKKDKKKSP